MRGEDLSLIREKRSFWNALLQGFILDRNFFGLYRTVLLISLLTALFICVGYILGGAQGVIISFCIAVVLNGVAFWNADKMVLRMTRAMEVNERNAPQLYALLRTLSVRAHLPVPRLYIIDQMQPNAFATGQNPRNSAVAVTTGLLQHLNEDEVAAVIAHELAHIENYDTLIMTITAVLAGALSMLGNLFFFSRRHPNQNSSSVFLIMISAVLAPLAAVFIQMAVSRMREYSADERGARISQNPLALASALEKISRHVRHTRNHNVESHPVIAHLFICNPLSRIDNLFSTHPDTHKRIALLKEMATYPEFLEVQKQSLMEQGPWGKRQNTDRLSMFYTKKGPWEK